MRRNLIVLSAVIAVAACNSTPIPTASANPSPSGIASPIPSPAPSTWPNASPSQSPTVDDGPGHRRRVGSLDWPPMPGTGSYVVPGALVPVEIDRERDVGRYVEPNYWMVHRTG